MKKLTAFPTGNKNVEIFFLRLIQIELRGAAGFKVVT